MLGYVDASTGNDKRRSRRDIERAFLIAAGAAGVENRFATDVYPMRLLAHDPRRAGNLLDGFAFHDLIHHRYSIGLGQIDAVDQFIDCFANIHRHFRLFTWPPRTPWKDFP